MTILATNANGLVETHIHREEERMKCPECNGSGQTGLTINSGTKLRGCLRSSYWCFPVAPLEAGSLIISLNFQVAEVVKETFQTSSDLDFIHLVINGCLQSLTETAQSRLEQVINRSC